MPLKLLPGKAIAQTYEAWRVLVFAGPGNGHLALLPWLRWAGVTAHIASALAGAISAAILYFIARRRGWSRWMGCLLVALYALNPMILYYAANGMDEMAFVALLLLSLAMYWEWHCHGRWIMNAGMGLAMAVALATHHEGLVFAAALGMALAVHLFTDRRGTIAQAEGTMLAYLSPIVYMIFLWFCWNGRVGENSLGLAHES